MNDIREVGQTKGQKTGWRILTVISVLILLNGIGWFFGGPRTNLSYIAELSNVSLNDYQQRYPDVVAHLARTERQVAIWYAAFGAMALVVSLDGLRTGNRRAWYAALAIAAAPFAIGIVYTPGGQLNAEGGFLMGFGILALVGLLLAKKGQVS